MPKTHRNNSEDNFPEFNLTPLQHYAKEWVDDNPKIQIERIILYRYNTTHQDMIRNDADEKFDKIKSRESIQYAVVFKISNCENTKVYEDEILNGICVNLADCDIDPDKEIHIRVDLTEEDISPGDDECMKFMKKCRQAHKVRGRYHPFLNSGFQNPVYKRGTTGDFRKEWIFDFKRPKDKLSGAFLVNKPCLVLYERKRKKELPDGAIDLMKKASKELELLYGAITPKKLGINSRSVDKTHRQKAALKYFKNNEKDFKFIKKEYLESEDLYIFTTGHERRGFIGRLLQKLIESNNFGRFSIQGVILPKYHELITSTN